MTDQHEQHRTNEAAEQFTDALVESYKTVTERGASAQEQGAQLTEDFFNRVVENLRTQAEENRQMTEQLADQQQRQADAVQSLAQESADAYEDFLDSIFFYYGEQARAAEKGTREGQQPRARED